MSSEVEINANKPSRDQLNWILISAYTHLMQSKVLAAVTQLEFLRLFEHDNLSAKQMLAYAYFLLKETDKCQKLMDEMLSDSKLPIETRTLLHLIQMRLLGDESQVKKARQLYTEHISQLALPQAH